MRRLNQVGADAGAEPAHHAQAEQQATLGENGEISQDANPWAARWMADLREQVWNDNDDQVSKNFQKNPESSGISRQFLIQSVCIRAKEAPCLCSAKKDVSPDSTKSTRVHARAIDFQQTGILESHITRLKCAMPSVSRYLADPLQDLHLGERSTLRRPQPREASYRSPSAATSGARPRPTSSTHSASQMLRHATRQTTKRVRVDVQDKTPVRAEARIPQAMRRGSFQMLQLRAT